MDRDKGRGKEKTGEEGDRGKLSRTGGEKG